MYCIALSFTLVTALLAPSLPAQAAGSLTRAFVSSAGVDSNPCTTAQPCATFGAAYSAVAANGIVAALDPGKYGPLTIMGPVTIDGNGWAAITAPSNGAGITINAGPSDDVILRGLTIDGGGIGLLQQQNGIVFNSGASLTVDGCAVRNVVNDGLDFLSTGTATPTLTLFDSHFIKNGDRAVHIQALSSGGIMGSVDHTEFVGDTVGLQVDGGLVLNDSTAAITVSVSDSVFANGGQGFVISPGTHYNNVVLTRVQVSGNTQAIIISPGSAATVWLAQSTFTQNTDGFVIGGGGPIINSFGDNYFEPSYGSLTQVSKQ